MTTKVSKLSGKIESLYAVIQQIRPAFRHISKTVEKTSSDFGLSIGTRAILEKLTVHGPQTVPALAKALDVERQYVQRNVNDLLDNLYVEKQMNPIHKRSWIIAITPEGYRKFNVLHSQEHQMLRSIAGQLSDEEIDNARHVLQLLSETFQAINKESGHG